MEKGNRIAQWINTVHQVVKSAISSIATVAARAMEGASSTQKIVVYICFGIIVLGSLALLFSPPDQIVILLIHA